MTVTMAMPEEFMLTTVDNPYDPFTQYEEWDVYDQTSGYFTAALLARVANTSEQLSETEYEEAIDAAMDDIISLFGKELYRKTKRNELKSS